MFTALLTEIVDFFSKKSVRKADGKSGVGNIMVILIIPMPNYPSRQLPNDQADPSPEEK